MPTTPPKIHNVAPYAFDIVPNDTDYTIQSSVINAGNTKNYSNCTLLCKATGNITFITSDGQTLVFAAVPAYTVIPIQVRCVKSTGTTGSWVGMVCTNG